jgi:hypothetical protein
VTDCLCKDTDSCAVPVLSPSEAAELSSEEAPHPHPSLSRTSQPRIAEALGSPPPLPTKERTEQILDDFGILENEKAKLIVEGALGAIRSKL